MRELFGIIFCLCICRPLLSETLPAKSTLAQRPNILFVLTDDQAPWAVGSAVQTNRFTDVPAAFTPNIDRLAREGAVFTNFFCTTPVCSPARAALATGRYASEFGILDFIPSPDHKLFDPTHEVALEPDESVTFAEVLQRAGYQTGLIGKWHLGDWTADGHNRFHPTNHGYDQFMGLTSGGTSPSNPMLEIDGKVKHVKGLTTDILTDHAINFIKASEQKDAPFLLCFHTRAPHGAWLPVAPEDWEPYADLDPKIPSYPDLDVQRMKKSMREYLASTSGVDRNLGRLLQTLDDLELADNTIVIFTSDHGYNMGHNGIHHKGNGIWATRKRPPGKIHNGTRVISNQYRPNMYDLSLKVPAIVKWAKVVKSGTIISDTATSLDVFPTLLEMANVPVPNDIQLRGRSLLSLLKGNSPTDWKQDLYAEYSMINYSVATMRCYRTPEFKLVRDFHNPGRDEFFDLINDPEERHNLILDPRPEIQDRIEELDAKLTSQMNELK